MLATFLLVFILVANSATQPTSRQKLQDILVKIKLTEEEQRKLRDAEKEYDKRFQICLDQECVAIQDTIINLQRQRSKAGQLGRLSDSYLKCLEMCQKKGKHIVLNVEKLQERSEVYAELLELQNDGEVEAALEYWDKVKDEIDV
uniref:Uncharacterized protein n=1 Tax=Trichuris muris TaxID=70415 RepID=A0A5S6PZS5_TRIMR